MATISRANLYNVPKKQWNKWKPQAREVFNMMYSTVRANQTFFLHPQALKNSRTHWGTTAWNVAWTAADATQGANAVAERKALTISGV